MFKAKINIIATPQIGFRQNSPRGTILINYNTIDNVACIIVIPNLIFLNV